MAKVQHQLPSLRELQANTVRDCSGHLQKTEKVHADHQPCGTVVAQSTDARQQVCYLVLPIKKAQTYIHIRQELLQSKVFNQSAT